VPAADYGQHSVGSEICKKPECKKLVLKPATWKVLKNLTNRGIKTVELIANLSSGTADRLVRKT